jgi:hypothetical protein
MQSTLARSTARSRLATLALALGLVFPLVAGPADALVVRRSLDATGADDGARGRMILRIRGKGSRRSGALVVRVAGLAARATFDVTVDDIPIGTLDTSRRGKGMARFRTRPRRREQLLGVDPRGREIRVVAAGGGAAVLGTKVPERGLDPGDVRCCLPDDSGAECEDRTPEECAAQGGTDLGAGSCLPSPCAGATPGAGDGVRCCIPDDSGPECEDRTAAECAAKRGVSIGAGTCIPNPCGGTTTGTTLPGGGTPAVRVRCERRASRSKISVDGTALAAGDYSARIGSGASMTTSELLAAVGGEAEFDFDSDPGDIAAGATPIAAGFIQGTPPQVTGTLLSASGGTVAEDTVTCTER